MAKYIGKRIVPVHCGRWDQMKAYEMLSIVLEENSGDSYISRRAVPSGTAITDTNYWMLHSLYSQQIKDMSDQLMAAEQRIKADNDATESAIRQDNDATEAAIRQDNQQTREHVDSSLEQTTEELTETVTQAQTAMTQQKASFDATAQQLNTRMDAVLSAGTGTGETEILDARVDANGNTYASLGESIRRVDGFLSRVQKIPFVFKERSESDATVGTGSTIVCTRLENRGVFSGMDVALTMNNQESYPAHWVRSYFHIPDQEFQEKYNGKKICIQVWSSAECDIYWAYGYWPAFNELYTVCEWQRLHPGYNEFIMDTGSDEYKSKEKYPGYDFYVNYLFGSYSGRPLMEDGEYNFRISLFMDEDLGYGLPGSTGAIESVFSAHSLLARHSEEADYAAEAEHAVDADNAQNAVHAQDSRRVGAVTIVKEASMAQTPYMSFLTRDSETGKIDVHVTSDWIPAPDCGLTIKLGTMEELRGSTIILYKEEVLPFAVVALNAGASWGNQTYGTVDFEPLYDNYWIADFDTLFETLRRRTSHVPEDFDGTFWMMIYGNDQWQIPAEGEGFHNYYGVYQVAKDSFIYTPMMWSIKEAIDGLEERTDVLEESVPTEQTIRDLRERCRSLEASLEAVKAGNVLWGKKYFATGDSFTEGDFSGWTDEEGRSGRNSPIIYDSDWKMYKTYPWWIARRNNMTLINDGKCGSIMPLSKEYLNGDEGVTENNRLPFSLNRYKTIPADVDYITLWFGINDSGHTNLGTINDTTNETYYGAWNVVMEYLITNYPVAKIGIIITNNAAATYRQATRDIALKWDRLYAAIQNPYGVAGVMGNMQAESSLRSNNLQNTYEKSLGLSDEQYTAAVDSGSYTNFVNDKAGFGLVQWTFWSLKEGLLNYAKSQGASIADWKMQVDYFLKEMKEEYTSIWKVLTTAKTVRDASNAVLLKFERPADQSEAVQVKRAGYGEEFFKKYASEQPAPQETSQEEDKSIVLEEKYAKYINSTGTHYISNSGSDERGQYAGGQAGDQTGKEWRMRDWYNRPWSCVLRYPDQTAALKLAMLGIDAALNDHVGYDQSQNRTYLKQLKAVGWEPSKITVDCEADCSAGVCANVTAVGYLLGIPALQNHTGTYTGNMRAALTKAGFQLLTDSKYLTSGDYLLTGDILLNDGHHTATNVTIGKKVKGEWNPGAPSSDPVAPAQPVTTVPAQTKYYRVRKSWADKQSQIGAYTVFQNAVNAVDANPGYAAFDDNGYQVYPVVQTAFTPYLVKISIEDLNYRKGPSTSYASYGYIPVGVYTIVDEQDGWGLLKAYADKRNGWISLAYTTRI